MLLFIKRYTAGLATWFVLSFVMGDNWLAACQAPSQNVPGKQAQSANSQEIEMPDDIAAVRDRAYREAVQAAAKSGVVWKQQPGNILALRRLLDSVDRSIDTLWAPNASGGEAAPSSRDKAATRKSAGNDTKKSTAARPAGPVSPSPLPPDPDELERREKATFERSYKPIKGFEKAQKPPRSLRRISPAWIEKKRLAAKQVLAQIDGLLQKDDVNQLRMNTLLKELRDELDAMANPPVAKD